MEFRFVIPTIDAFFQRLVGGDCRKQSIKLLKVFLIFFCFFFTLVTMVVAGKSIGFEFLILPLALWAFVLSRFQQALKNLK